VNSILLIRHGENDVMKNRLAGRLPGTHLNEAGREQAFTLASVLENIPLQAIYSSPLERAIETAQPVAIPRNIAIQISPNLNELNYGSWEGKTYKQLMRLSLWKQLKKDPSSVRFPDGECLQEVKQRAVDEIERIHRSLQDKETAACFTHGDVIRLAISHYLDMPLNSFDRLCVNTTSVTMIVFNENTVVLPYINWTGLPFPKQLP